VAAGLTVVWPIILNLTATSRNMTIFLPIEEGKKSESEKLGCCHRYSSFELKVFALHCETLVRSVSIP